MVVVQLSSSRKKWIILVAFLIAVVLGVLGAITYFAPPRREYVVLREIPVVTHYLRTETTTATLLRTVVSSLASPSVVTRTSFIATIAETRYDPRTVSWIATTTDTVVTVIGNTTHVMLTRTLVYSYVFTTSVPVTYFVGIPTVVTETTTRWTSFNQTVTLTTTMTSTASSASTYTRTIWTTVTAPPGAAVLSQSASNRTDGFAALAFCSTLVAGVLVLRKGRASLQTG